MPVTARPPTQDRIAFIDDPRDKHGVELGEWDEAMLRDEFAGLLAEDFALSLLGSCDEDLDALLRNPDQIEGGAVEGEGDMPEPPDRPVSLAGDLWQLGSRRLICGDSTSADLVGRLLGAVPRRRGLCLAWRCILRRWPRAWWRRVSPCGRRSSGPRIASSFPATMTIGSTNPVGMPSRIPARALGGRPQADHAAADCQQGSGCADRPRHAEAGWVHAPPDPEQFQPQPSRV